MSQDWLFQTEKGTCSFRCAGVLIQNGKVLLQRADGEYALPGGHVQVGETGKDAVEREWKEEMGADIQCLQLLWTEECFWQWNSRTMHTLSFYYLAALKTESVIPDDGQFHPCKDNPKVQIGWVPFEQLDELTVYPSFLKQEIHHLKPGHFVTQA